MTAARRLVAPTVALMALSMPVSAANPVVLHTRVVPEQGALVGQRMELTLEVLAADGWASVPRPPEFDIAGAYVLRVESQGARASATINGTPHSGQRYRWLLYPQRDGRMTVPATPVDVEVKVFGTAAGPVAHTLSTPPLAFDIAPPPGAEDLPGIVSTASLSAVQSFDPDKVELRIGDGIRRTVTIAVEGIPGIALLPLEGAVVDGLAAYPGEPVVRDEIERGNLRRGVRSETVTYVPERPGIYTLPDLAIDWWDIGEGVLRRETLEGPRIVVSGAPGAEVGQRGARTDSTGTSGMWRAWIPLILLVVASGLAWHRRRAIGDRVARWKAARARTERARFNRFLKAARDGQPREAVAALVRWIDRLGTLERPASLATFLERFGSGGNGADAILRVYATGACDHWPTGDVVREASAARRNYRRHSRCPRARNARLAPLNPGGDL